MPSCAIPTSTARTTTTSMKPTPPISPRLLSYLFTSLSHSPRQTSTQLLSNATNSSSPPSSSPRKWHLRRILRSENPADINGELIGTATFHLLHQNNNTNNTNNNENKHREIVYKEEGEMPSFVPGMAGMKWSKKYIWRLNNSNSPKDLEDGGDGERSDLTSAQEEDGIAVGGISVWFVKITSSGRERSQQNGIVKEEDEEEEEEADYLFHEFNFTSHQQGQQQQQQQEPKEQTSETTNPASLHPPIPPPLTSPTLKQTYPETEVILATGDHLCVKDMYYTAYSFRIVPETGEVLSWASRHIVKGPKKNQDILNLYSIEA